MMRPLGSIRSTSLFFFCESSMKYKQHIAALRKTFDTRSLLNAATRLTHVRSYFEGRSGVGEPSTALLRLYETASSVMNPENTEWLGDAEGMFDSAIDQLEQVESLIEHPHRMT